MLLPLVLRSDSIFLEKMFKAMWLLAHYHKVLLPQNKRQNFGVF